MDPKPEADENEAAHDAEQYARSSPRHRGHFAFSLAILAIVLIVGLQATATWTDHQIANLLSGVLIVVAVIACYLGWLLRYRPGRRIALLPIVAGAIGIGLFFALFRYKGVSGEMVPQFTYRFASPPDYQTVVDASNDAAAVRLEVDPQRDYWQYLGPERTGHIEERLFGLQLPPEGPERLWQIPVGAGWAGFACADEYAVTIEQRGHLRDGETREEWVTCYRIDDGSLVWSQHWPAYHYHPLGGTGPRATPTIHDGRVYVQGATGILAALSGEDGSIIWEHDLLDIAGWDQSASENKITWGRSGSPLIYDDLVIVPFGAPEGEVRSLIAFDKTDGTERWRGGGTQIAYTSPLIETVAGTKQILSVNEDNVAGYDPKTGQELWQHPWPGNSAAAANCSQPVVLGPTEVLVSKGYGGGGMLLRVEQVEGEWQTEEVWQENRALKTKFTSAVEANDHLFALSDGSLQCVAVETGEVVWQQPRRGRYGQGQLIIVDDVIIVQAETGEVALVAANVNQFEEISRFAALEGKTWNYPAIQGRYLLLRNAEQAACFRLPEREAG